MLSTILERIHFYNTHLKPTWKMSFHFSSPKNIATHVHRHLRGKYIAPESIPIALKTLKSVGRSEYTFEGHDVKVALFGEKKDADRFGKIIHLINQVLLIADAINPGTARDNVNIYLFDLDFPKILETGCQLDYKHVNTGVSYKTDITVYRKEELGKVLIHEMLHRFRFEIIRTHPKQADIATYFGLKEINVNEAYVDSIALMINVAVYVNGKKSEFNRKWEEELKHVYQQALCVSKVYYHLYKDLKVGQLIHEKTNVISYYVVKAMIYSAYGEGTDISAIHNGLSYDRWYSDTSELLKKIEQQFSITSEFWKEIQRLLLNHKGLYSCRHGDSLRMSTLDCI